MFGLESLKQMLYILLGEKKIRLGASSKPIPPTIPNPIKLQEEFLRKE